MRSGLIVFIHGLGGHPVTTWGRFPDLVREDPAFAKFDVWCYSFTTSLTRWPWSRRNPKIQDLAQALRSQFENRFQGQNEVTLVCHSLGGLIARRYLLDEVKSDRPLRVRNLMLYAVPNSGSGLANLGQELTWRHGQLGQLARDAGFLFDLNEEWARLGLSDRVRVKYVVALQDRVVDLTSARAFPGNPDVETVDDRGHRSLVKPESADDLSYLIFRNFMAVPRIPPAKDAVTKVAVTRFQSTGGDAENEIVANGVTERLINILANLDGVHAVPRVAMTRQGDRTPMEIAEDFNADYLVEGTFERFPGSDRCTIFVRLVKVGEERPEAVWSDRYERPWSDAQQVLVDVAGKVARRIKHAVSQEELRRLEDAPVRPLAAWEAFMEGSWRTEEYNNRHAPSDFRRAEAYLKKALQLDPDYVEAREHLGFLYVLAWEALGREGLLSKSREVWEELLERDPENAFALAELGYLTCVQDADDVRGVELARRGVRSDPDLTIAHNVLALLHLYLGYYESHAQITRDEVFLRDPYYIYPYTNLALSLQLREHYAEALQYAREARRIERHAMVAVLLEGAQHFHRGSLEEAQRIWREGIEFCEDPSDKGILDAAVGWTLARGGDLEGARERIRLYRHERWVAGGYGPYFISLCSLAGERDLAMGLLEGAVTYARSYRYLVSDRTLERLTGDPRFEKLLQKRYETWRRNLEKLGPDLPVPPAAVPTPEAFLGRVQTAGEGGVDGTDRAHR